MELDEFFKQLDLATEHNAERYGENTTPAQYLVDQFGLSKRDADILMLTISARGKAPAAYWIFGMMSALILQSDLAEVSDEEAA